MRVATICQGFVCLYLIGDYAFEGCRTLSRVDIPSFVSEIGQGAFCGCENLKDCNFGWKSSLEKLGAFAFKDCSSLASISLPYGIKAIDEETFSGCVSLNSIVIPSSVSTITPSTFKGCSKLDKILSKRNWDIYRDEWGLPPAISNNTNYTNTSDDFEDIDDRTMVHTHGRMRPCPYCDSDDISTYIDGTAYCHKCGKWYRYA